ncbi:MAG TPA: D-aminoacyl-tRNA deacylase [Nitrososphaeraceae archaeon]
MANYTLVCSNKDLASKNLSHCLIENFGFTKESNSTFSSNSYPNIVLHISENNLLYLDNLDEKYPNSSCFIFLSQHRSQANIPALTCHSTGNFDKNNFGGKERELGICYPWLQKQYLIELSNQKYLLPHYDIIIESTHHGPTSLKKPILFIEIGSTEKQWTDKIAASTVCKSLIKVIAKKYEFCVKVGIALGGNHYPTKFNKMLLESEYGLGAIATKYDLPYLDSSLIEQMISRNIEKVNYAVVDSKGLGKEKSRILSVLEQVGIEVVRI